MPKMNEEEYKILKELDDKWKWIARDGYNNRLYAYTSTSKPIKSMSMRWWKTATLPLMLHDIKANLFQFIKWLDESPYNIQELIDEYEVCHGKLQFESEEKEVSKKELRTSVEHMSTYKFGEYDKHHDKLSKVTSYVEKVEVINLIDQLDEQEAVVIPWDPVKVKIPRFVAEWLEYYIDKKDLFTAMAVGFEGMESAEMDHWLQKRENQDTFAKAWIDYPHVEVEEQPHSVLKAFDEKAEEYENYRATSVRVAELRQVIKDALEEAEI